MNNLGRKKVLHSVPFPALEKKKSDRFAIIEIVEIKDIPDAWSDKIHEGGGWKAKSEDGRIFLCNWGTFPSDSMSPTWMWYEVDENGKYIHDWYDITQGLYGVPFLPKALENNGIVDYCEKHRCIYEINKEFFGSKNEPSCFQCWLDFKYPHKREEMVYSIEGGNWKGWS